MNMLFVLKHSHFVLLPQSDRYKFIIMPYCRIDSMEQGHHPEANNHYAPQEVPLIS
jgi:hypothetical protein